MLLYREERDNLRRSRRSDSSGETVDRRGHYFVYTPESLRDLMQWSTGSGKYGLELIASEDPDMKVGNGFTLV
jgi:hypothetical protein